MVTFRGFLLGAEEADDLAGEAENGAPPGGADVVLQVFLHGELLAALGLHFDGEKARQEGYGRDNVGIQLRIDGLGASGAAADAGHGGQGAEAAGAFLGVGELGRELGLGDVFLRDGEGDDQACYGADEGPLQQLAATMPEAQGKVQEVYFVFLVVSFFLSVLLV